MKKHCVRYGYVISLILLVFMTIFFSVRSYHLGKYEGAFSQSEVTVLNDVWTKTPDVSESGDKDSYLVYSYTTKNEEPRHQVLAIESYWMMMEVFVGENKVFECKDDNRNRGIIVRWIDLPDDIAGKTIRIRTLNDEKALDLKLIGTCCLGQKDAILTRMLLRNGYVVIFAIITFLTSVTLFLTLILFRRKIPAVLVSAFTNLGLFILTAGVWIVVNSRLLQFFTGQAIVIALVYFLSLYLMPVFCLMFMKEMLSKNYPVLGYLAFGFELLLVVSVFINKTIGIPMYRLVYAEHALVLVSIGVVIKYAIQELQMYQKKMMRTLVKGIGLLFVFSFIAIVEFHIDHDSGYAIWFCLGMLIFIVVMWRVGISGLFYRLEIDRQIAENEKTEQFDPLSGMENGEAFQRFRNAEEASGDLTYVRFVIENDIDYVQKEAWRYEQLIFDVSDSIQTIFGSRGKCYRLNDREFMVVLKYVKTVQVEECLKNIEAIIHNKNRHRREPVKIRYAFAQMPQECDEEIELYDLVEERVHI